jgi:hypothetical protein
LSELRRDIAAGLAAPPARYSTTNFGDADKEKGRRLFASDQVMGGNAQEGAVIKQ